MSPALNALHHNKKNIKICTIKNLKTLKSLLLTSNICDKGLFSDSIVCRCSEEKLL